MLDAAGADRDSLSYMTASVSISIRLDGSRRAASETTPCLRWRIVFIKLFDETEQPFSSIASGIARSA
jgi:hypothetical protein